MRFFYLVFYIFLSVPPTWSKTMTFKEVMAESAALRKNMANAKNQDLKKEELKTWETKLKSTLKSYEMENPKEGNSEEDFIGKYFLSMEPIFDLAKHRVSKENCKKTRHQIELEDRDNTKKNPSQLSKEAKEALAVLKLFCR